MISTANRNPIPICTCKDGYYEDSAFICQKCAYICATCVTLYGNCLTCSTGTNRV